MDLDVILTEVGPRDGLQNESTPVGCEDKITFISLLEAAGVPEVEITSFVRPDLIPQMADAADVVAGLTLPADGVFRSALIPNLRGYERAVEAGLKKVCLFTAATDAFNQANINTDIDGSLSRFRPVIERARIDGVVVRAYISAAFLCPITGVVDPHDTRDVAIRLRDMGITEIVLGDTTGAATPGEVGPVLDAVQPMVPAGAFGLHFHDTMGSGLVNAYLALGRGVRRFDTSVGGLGGCPNAPGAAGNIATEDMVWLLDGIGFHHGIDLEGVVKAGQFIQSVVGHPLTGRVLTARCNPGQGSGSPSSTQDNSRS